jgi:hypothetical protein
MKKDLFHQFTQVSYSGRKLLEKHSLEETGIWRVRGEDPNADLHGPHYQPELGVVSGVLRDVIHYAVELPSFWQWGAGGDIVKIEIKPINPDEVARLEALRVRAQNLEEELAAVRAQLPK